jgi:DNA repair protein RecO (recombination protein O)
VSARQRIDQQPGFVLHSYPYRETSLIVEVFSRDHGRIGLVAKGARRPMSQLRGVLMAFQPLLIDWSGGGEMKTLVRAEWQAASLCWAGRRCCAPIISTSS